MREEDVTKAILKWLIGCGWEIVVFDFPQSGTGKFLHPDGHEHEKNQDSINPDIVAVKNEFCVFFENKNRFYLPDFIKINKLRTTADYTHAIEQLLSTYHFLGKKYYGIGMPSKSYTHRAQEKAHLVDFVIGVEEDKEISILYDPNAGCPEEDPFF